LRARPKTSLRLSVSLRCELHLNLASNLIAPHGTPVPRHRLTPTTLAATPPPPQATIGAPCPVAASPAGCAGERLLHGNVLGADGRWNRFMTARYLRVG